MSDIPSCCVQLQSLVNDNNTIRLSLETVSVPEPSAGELIVRIEAAPINPSDLLVLTAQANFEEASDSSANGLPGLTADLPESAAESLKKRIGKAMSAGFEASGTVIAAGNSPEAQAMLGKSVSCVGGPMFAEFVCLPVANCNVLPKGLAVKDAAALFVNPLTSLCMLDAMRKEGHSGIILTAASSSLGLIVNRLCQAEGVPIVSIVRKPEQEAQLLEMGVQHVLNSESEGFLDALTDAVAETGATLGFDMVGGGPLAGQILTAIEKAASRGKSYDRYGSNVNNQVYISGRLDRRPIEIPVGVGLTWKMGGFLLLHYLPTLSDAERSVMSEKILKYHDSIFATRFAKEISLKDAVSVNEICRYADMKSGEKYLINPTLF